MLIILIILLAVAAVVGLLASPATTWGSVLFAFSMYFLGLIYALFGFLILNGKKLKSKAIREMSFNQAFFAAMTGWGIGTIIIGILFKFQFWPGANVLLVVGLIWVIVLLIVDVYLAVKDENSKVLAKNAIIHGAIALILGILVATMSYDHVIRFMVKDKNDEKVLIGKYYDWMKTKDQTLRDDFDRTYSDVMKKQHH